MDTTRKTGRPRLAGCHRGHSLRGSNLYLEPKSGRRHCKKCLKLYKSTYYYKQKKKKLATGFSAGRPAVRREALEEVRSLPVV